MKLPDAVKAVRARYIAAFPVPSLDADETASEFETRVRGWTMRLIEQVVFELPGQGWGAKSRPNDGPISKDGIALSTRTRADWEGQQAELGRMVLLWDLLVGVGSGHPTLNEDPDSQDVSDQQFIPVQGVNHLGDTTPTPTPDPTPGPVPPVVDYLPLFARLESQLTQAETNSLNRFNALTSQIKALPTVWEGSFKLPYFGTVTVRLTPGKP